MFNWAQMVRDVSGIKGNIKLAKIPTNKVRNRFYSLADPKGRRAGASQHLHAILQLNEIIVAARCFSVSVPFNNTHGCCACIY